MGESFPSAHSLHMCNAGRVAVQVHEDVQALVSNWR